jgi:hypothetical protein
MELYRNIPAFPNFANRISAAATGSGFNTMTLVYVLLVAFVLYFVGLMILNKPLDLSWLDPRPKSMVVTADAYNFWKPSAIFTNLVVKPGSIPGFKSTEYSTILDVLLINTRTFKGAGGPWRHIFHRGSDELAPTTVGGALRRTGCAAAANSGGALPPFGLPKRMNPGIFLDPNTNDVVVFVDTERGGDMHRESVRLVDLPMNIPFRIGVIVNGKVLEVYLNCKLEVSKVLTGRPRSVDDTWYGLSGAAAAGAQIQNLYIWKRALPSDQIGSVCPKLPSFDVVRPTCDMADSPMPEMKTPKSKPLSASIGYGNALSSCPTNK